jgi:hypothetical protein
VLVESRGGTGVSPAGRAGLEKAAASMRDSLGPVIGAAADMIDAFLALPRRPQEVEVQFGVTLDATVGAIIAGGSAGAHLAVTLRWSPDAPTLDEGQTT